MIDAKMATHYRKVAINEMNRRRAKHACYGLSYDNIEELADFPEEIKYFRTDEEFYDFIEDTRERYAEYGIHDVRFYAVHAR